MKRLWIILSAAVFGMAAGPSLAQPAAAAVPPPAAGRPNVLFIAIDDMRDWVWVAPGVTKPGVKNETPIDFMTIYPTLTDLCGVPTPSHVQGQSVRRLLTDATVAWPAGAVTTYKFNNHAVRTPEHRYIRYANGDEELYDENADPNEWTNLATRPEQSATKQRLGELLPKQNQPDIGGRGGAEDFGDAAARQERRQRRNQAVTPSTQPAARP